MSWVQSFGNSAACKRTTETAVRRADRPPIRLSNAHQCSAPSATRPALAAPYLGPRHARATRHSLRSPPLSSRSSVHVRAFNARGGAHRIALCFAYESHSRVPALRYPSSANVVALTRFVSCLDGSGESRRRAVLAAKGRFRGTTPAPFSKPTASVTCGTLSRAVATGWSTKRPAACGRFAPNRTLR